MMEMTRDAKMLKDPSQMSSVPDHLSLPRP